MTRKSKSVVWITGGGTGIGKELAKSFADLNYKVIISGRRLEKINEVMKYNPKCIKPMQLDVSKPDRCKNTVNSIVKNFGNIDIIILNAATYSPGSLDKLEPLKIKSIIETNILGPINCLAPILEKMKKRQKGHIVFMSSPAGYRGLPGAGIYGVTKSALTFFAETLKIELDSFNIKVQVIHPGFVKTAMTDKNTFEMPFMISAKNAAEQIMRKIFSNKFEIFFPKRLILPMKFLSILPAPIYFYLMKKFVKKKLNG